jgi:RNA polymerase sigma factor (sigma-70 family)
MSRSLSVPADAATIDITAVTRLKHADLWAAAKQFATKRYGGQSALARRLGLRPSEFGRWINLLECPPATPNKAWPAERLDQLESDLMEITGKTLEQLFPAELRSGVALMGTSKTFERTAAVEMAALERYAIATTERLAITSRPFQAEEERDRAALIAEVVDRLPLRERVVVQMRYGLGDYNRCTLDEVGKALHVTRERVRQLEGRALRRIQALPQRVWEKLEDHYVEAGA